jgi:hypothetical protein
MGALVIILAFYWFGPIAGLVALFLVAACQHSDPSFKSERGRLVAVFLAETPPQESEPNTEDQSNRDWMNDFLRSRARTVRKEDAKAPLPRPYPAARGWRRG